MRCMKKLLLLSLAWVWLIPMAMAQQIVSGKVTDYLTGEPLPGVNIIIQGTTTGTVTDMDGNYSLQVPGSESILSFSFIGYETEDVTVGEQTTINISLMPDLTSLDEIVVVGYGTQKKKVVTGATAEVASEDIVRTNSLRIEQALQGQTPGVQISSTSGQPGEGLKVRIRGTGTLGNSDPLYVVDGVPVDNISYLSPSAIDRVDVLKDAASAAIYGARAANGVVLITTKKGRDGEMRLSLDSYYGVQNFYRKLPMLNAQEYAVIMNEANINSGQLPIFTQSEIENMGEGTDWLEEATNKNAPIQNHALTLTGGNEISNFSSSLSYFQQEGIIAGEQSKSNFERISFSINSSHKAYKDIVRIGENLTYSRIDQSGLRVGGIYNNSLRGLFNTSPVFPVYDSNGDFAQSPIDVNETNPIGLMHYSDFNKNIVDRIVGNLYTEVEPLEGLVFRSDFGVDVFLETRNSYNPEFHLNPVSYNNISNATQGATRNMRWNWDNTLAYSKSIEKHNFDILLGVAAQKENNVWMSARKEGLIFNDFEHAILNNATSDSTIVATGSKSEYALASQFGRINYNYGEKYLLTATVRRDGSSNFGANNKYGVFPSVSAGWVLSEESFLYNNPIVNFLKLRASWGQNGNDRIASFAYMATLESRYREYYFGSGETKHIGTSPYQLANPDLKWEASEQINIGIDATLLRNVTLSADYYQKSTKDWLVIAPVPDIAGTNAPWINGGNIENSGFELQASYNNTFGDLTFGISGNVAFNKNEVISIANSEGIIHGDANVLQGISEFNRAEEGFPVGYFWGYEVAGIFQNAQEIQDYRNNETVVQPTAKPGDVKFVDRNRDGVINEQDKTMIGDPNPDVTYGLNLNLGYKGFDLSVYTYGMGGHQNVFGYRAYERWYNNYTTDILNRWHGEGTSNTLPRVTLNDEPNQNYIKFSELYIQDASFFRVKTVNLGYDFSRLLPDGPFNQLRLYFSANNLFTFTKYKGLDPEVGFAPATSPQAGVEYNMSSGVDVGYYPQPRTFLLGLNIQF